LVPLSNAVSTQVGTVGEGVGQGRAGSLARRALSNASGDRGSGMGAGGTWRAAQNHASLTCKAHAARTAHGMLAVRLAGEELQSHPGRLAAQAPRPATSGGQRATNVSDVRPRHGNRSVSTPDRLCSSTRGAIPLMMPLWCVDVRFCSRQHCRATGPPASARMTAGCAWPRGTNRSEHRQLGKFGRRARNTRWC
jgi:hypothetical protein